MATVQHPAPARTHIHHNLDWLWIGLSVVVVALVAGGIAWAVFQPNAPVQSLPAEVQGFEYTQEATAGQIAMLDATGEYFGNSGELYPAVTVASSAQGFAYDNESTAAQFGAPAVIGEYFGNSGELYPEAAAVRITDSGEAASLMRSVDMAIAAMHPAMLGGFELNHEVTAGHLANLGMTGEYFGYSGEINPDR